MNKKNKITNFLKKLAPAIHLWPAALTLILVAAALLASSPVSADLPEKLAAVNETEENTATGSETEEETISDEEGLLAAESTQESEGDSENQIIAALPLDNETTLTAQESEGDGETQTVDVRQGEGEEVTTPTPTDSGNDINTNKSVYDTSKESQNSTNNKSDTGSKTDTDSKTDTGSNTDTSSVAPTQAATVSSGYADGVYTSSALCTDDDEFSYQIIVNITVLGGKISQVTVEKGEDTSYDPDSNDPYLTYAIEGRTRKSVWYEGVVNQIIQKQSAQQIDVVSGATYSSKSIAEAAKKALESK